MLLYDSLKILNVFENWMKGTVDGDVYVDDLTTPTALVVIIPFYSASKQSSNSKFGMILIFYTSKLSSQKITFEAFCMLKLPLRFKQ